MRTAGTDSIAALKAKPGGELVESRVDSKGVTIQVYRPAGRPQYATT